MDWLRSHASEVLDMSTDKGLGTALVSRSEYERLASKVIEKSDVELTSFQQDRICVTAVLHMCELARFALAEKKVISKQVHDLWCCLLREYRVPLLRLLIKVHKKPVAARPIASGVSWVNVSASIWVGRQLQSVVKLLPTITDRFQNVLADLTLVVQDFYSNSFLSTFDVANMYPSIDHERCIAHIRQTLVEFGSSEPSWGIRVPIVCDAIRIIFASNILRYKAVGQQVRFYQQVLCIATGLCCAVELVNSCLCSMDLLVKDSLNAHITFYKRYIDDILVVLIGQARIGNIFGLQHIRTGHQGHKG